MLYSSQKGKPWNLSLQAMGKARAGMSLLIEQAMLHASAFLVRDLPNDTAVRLKLPLATGALFRPIPWLPRHQITTCLLAQQVSSVQNSIRAVPQQAVEHRESGACPKWVMHQGRSQWAPSTVKSMARLASSIIKAVATPELPAHRMRGMWVGGEYHKKGYRDGSE